MKTRHMSFTYNLTSLVTNSYNKVYNLVLKEVKERRGRIGLTESCVSPRKSQGYIRILTSRIWTLNHIPCVHRDLVKKHNCSIAHVLHNTLRAKESTDSEI